MALTNKLLTTTKLYKLGPSISMPRRGVSLQLPFTASIPSKVQPRNVRINACQMPEKQGKGRRASQTAPSTTGQATTPPLVFLDPLSSGPSRNGSNARSKIRKQAAKASAQQRLATIAEKVKVQRADRRRHEKQQQQRTAPGLVTPQYAVRESSAKENEPPESYTVTPTPSEVDDDVENTKLSHNSTAAGPLIIVHHENSFSPFDLRPDRIDPFMTLPIDFSGFNNNGILRWLFNYMTKSSFPVLDLRLPTKFDQVHGTRYIFSKILPGLALTSEPFFWALMMSITTMLYARNHLHPSALPLPMKFREKAVSSVNEALSPSAHHAAIGEGYVNDDIECLRSMKPNADRCVR